MSASPCEFATVRDLTEATFTYGYTTDGTPLKVNVLFVSTIQEEVHQDLVGENQVRIALKYASCVEFYFTEETANQLGRSRKEASASGDETLIIKYPDSKEFGFKDQEGGIYDPSDASSLSEETWDTVIDGLSEIAGGILPHKDAFDIGKYAAKEIADSQEDRASFVYDSASRTGMAQYFYFDVDEGSSPFDVSVAESLAIDSVENHVQDPRKELVNKFVYTVVP